jgi:hypothetical protein
MSEPANSFPWTLVAAIVAAAASIVSVVINTVVLSRKHRRDALCQIALRRYAWADDLRLRASEYVSSIAVLHNHVFSKPEFSESDPEVRQLIQEIYSKIHLILFSLREADRKEIEEWHDTVFTLMRDNKHDEVTQKVSRFVDLIAAKIDPEIVKAEHEFQGHTI